VQQFKNFLKFNLISIDLLSVSGNSMLLIVTTFLRKHLAGGISYSIGQHLGLWQP
jgi:hypothetical protein